MKNWDRPFWTKKSNNHIYDLIIPLPYSNDRYKHKICLDNCKNLSCVSDDNCDSEKKIINYNNNKKRSEKITGCESFLDEKDFNNWPPDGVLNWFLRKYFYLKPFDNHNNEGEASILLCMQMTIL